MKLITIQMIWFGTLLWFIAACNMSPVSAEAETTELTNQETANKENQPTLVTAGSGSTLQEPVQEPTCPLQNLTRVCTCKGEDGNPKAGRETCFSTGWSQCECAEVESTHLISSGELIEPPNNKGPEVFDWQRTVPTGGSCKAGYHEGLFDGLYNPDALAKTALGIFLPTLPVFGNVSFTIKEKPGTGGEIFEISDGNFTGSALVAFPFFGEFYGTLDCTTKTFTGVLKNCYYIVGFDKYAFDGIAVSEYDAINNTFVNGVWSVTEPVDSLIESPNIPQEEWPDVADLVFPTPLEVQPGVPFTDFYPVGFKGGTGTWWGSFVRP